MGDGGALDRGFAALEKAKPLFNGCKKKEAADLYKVRTVRVQRVRGAGNIVTSS